MWILGFVFWKMYWNIREIYRKKSGRIGKDVFEKMKKEKICQNNFFVFCEWNFLVFWYFFGVFGFRCCVSELKFSSFLFDDDVVYTSSLFWRFRSMVFFEVFMGCITFFILFMFYITYFIIFSFFLILKRVNNFEREERKNNIYIFKNLKLNN